MQKLRRIFESTLAIDIIVLALITLFIFSYFSPALIFLKTVTNGGDTGSHYPSAVYLKEVLLPQGKIMGWDQGNYAGYPLFYHYFPLPFILMSLLSYFIPMQIAFKLITLLGTALLPFAAYFAFRNLKYPFPVPIAAAVFTLPFIFNQGNSMWGGNIPSTLAGEFCYSLGLSLAVLLIGTLHRGVKENRFLVLNAVLIALVGMSHAYTLILALLIGSFFFLTDLKNSFKYLLSVYALGFSLMAFWMLPVLGNTPYITSFVFRWTISSILEVFPAVLIPFAALGLFAFINNCRDQRNNYFLYLLLGCAAIFLLGPNIGVLDIRFVPFFQVFLTLYSATAILWVLGDIKAVRLVPIICLLCVAIWSAANATYVRSWIEWNYSGYESKKTWPTLNGITQYLRTSGTGRVEWEHSPMDESLGSIRTYEMLPYFAKRQTLEGIHMLGAVSAPFVFYIESETSNQPCNPLPNYFYSSFNLKRGIDHFKLFNVDEFVVRSDQVKQEIAKNPEFKLEKTVGEYNVYRLLTCPETFVEPLRNQPVFFPTKEWRKVSYQWFADENLKDTFLVFPSVTAPSASADLQFAADQLEAVKTVPISGALPTVSSTLGAESIDINTSQVGWPLLIKVSYHPNWKVKGADCVYFVSPCFMLVYPKEHQVHLSFETGRNGVLGLWLSLIAAGLAASSFLWYKVWLSFNPLSMLPEINLSIVGWAWIAAAILLIALGFLAIHYVFPNDEALLKRGRIAFDGGHYPEAKELLLKALNSSQQSSGFHCEAEIFYATCFLRQGDFATGKEKLEAFIAHYPGSFWTPQAYFDLAYCEKSLGNLKSAQALYKQIIAQFPTTSWAQYSQERLKELK